MSETTEKIERLIKKIEEIRAKTNWPTLDIYYWIMNRSDRYSFEYKLIEKLVEDEVCS